jgi:hypothetical protein
MVAANEPVLFPAARSMKRLLFWSALLFTVNLFICIPVVMIGRTSHIVPNEAATNGLGLCSGMPCLMGVQPGKTLWRDASALIRQCPGVEIRESNGQVIEILTAGHMQAVFHPDLINSTVLEITVWFPPRQMSAASMIVALGQPSGIQVHNGRLISAFYAGLEVQFSATSERIELESSVRQMVFTNPSGPYKGQALAPDMPWRGFGALGRYR